MDERPAAHMTPPKASLTRRDMSEEDFKVITGRCPTPQDAVMSVHPKQEWDVL